MGLLGNLFKTTLGWGSNADGAYNACLAEYVLKGLKPEDKKIIANEVLAMGVRASNGRATEKEFCDKFNKSNRVCQLNLIALALTKLEVCLPNLKWAPVAYPFALNTTELDLLTMAQYFRKKHSIEVKVESERIDLSEWFSPSNNLTADDPFDLLPGAVLGGIENYIKKSTFPTDERFRFTMLQFGICYLVYLFHGEFYEYEPLVEDIKDSCLDLVLENNKEKTVPIGSCIVYKNELEYIGDVIDFKQVETVRKVTINYGELLCISYSYRAEALWDMLPLALGNSTNIGNPNLTSMLCKYIYDDESKNFIEVQHCYFQIIDTILPIMKKLELLSD